MAHLLREEGAVAAVRLDALLVEAEAQGVPLEDRLVAEGALTRPQRDRFVRTRDVLGRGCTRCNEPTFLLPGQGVGTKTCEHCGGRLRGGTSRRRRLGTDHFAEPPSARPSRRLEPRASRRLEARERLSRRFEEDLAAPPRPSRRLASPAPEIEPPRTKRRPPVPPRPSQVLKRGAEALAPRRTRAHGPSRSQGGNTGAPRRRTQAHGGKGEGGGGRAEGRGARQVQAPSQEPTPQRAERAARPTQRHGTAAALPPELARAVRQALEETRQDLVQRVRREARAEVGRELERLGAHELRQRLSALEGKRGAKKPGGEAAGREAPDTGALRRDLESRVEAALREAERRLDKRLADRDAETEERAGRQAGAAILAATAGRGAAGRSLAVAIEKEIRERGPNLVLESPRLAERVAAAIQAYLEAQGDAWLREHPALAELRDAAQAKSDQASEGEDLSASVAALRAESRADSAQVEALARVGAGVQERLAALEESLGQKEAPGGPSPELERRLRELEDGLVSERRARTKEVAELNTTHMAAAANAAREAAREATREETSRWGGLEGVEERVRAEGENALGEVLAQVERLGGRLSALERQLEARVRRQAGTLRVRHALRRSLSLGAILWGVLLVPLLIAGLLYPRVHEAKVPLGPPTRAPYAGSVQDLRSAITSPALLDEVAEKAGLPGEPGWAERVAGLPKTRGERLDVRLEPFGNPPNALYIRVKGLGAAQAEAAAAELSMRLEAVAEAAGAPLGQIHPPASKPAEQIWGWLLGGAALLALLAFGLAALRELRRKGFQDALELGDLVDLPVLLSVGPEERDQ